MMRKRGFKGLENEWVNIVKQNIQADDRSLIQKNIQNDAAASVVSSRDRPNLRVHRCGHMMRWSESVSDLKSETDGGKRRQERRPSLSYFHTSSLNQCCKKRRVSTDRCFSSVSDRLGWAGCMKQYCNIPKIKVRQVKSNLFMTHIHKTTIIGGTTPVMQFKYF